MLPFVELIVARLVPLMSDDASGSAALVRIRATAMPFRLNFLLAGSALQAENAAITISRVACSCPESTAPMLDLFCRQWCENFPRIQSITDLE